MWLLLSATTSSFSWSTGFVVSAKENSIFSPASPAKIIHRPRFASNNDNDEDIVVPPMNLKRPPAYNPDFKPPPSYNPDYKPPSNSKTSIPASKSKSEPSAPAISSKSFTKQLLSSMRSQTSEKETISEDSVSQVSRGGASWRLIPAGWNPFGYKLSELGEEFLNFEGALDCDVGRFLASLRERKRLHTLKGQWLEVVRVAKTGQAMRIYRNIDDLLRFCLRTGLIN
jgi:hypothetical protein